jgi:hypothetical protein
MLDRAAAAEVAHGIKETLEKGTNADKPVHEMGRIGKAFETLKEHAMEIGTAIAAAFALEKLFEFGKESAHAALESRKEWNLLGNALENVGTDLGTVREELEKHMDTFIKAGTAGEDDYVRVLRSLVQLSGDYEKSLGNVQVVVDLAAAKQIDLQTAALLVGKAMNGQGAMLKRYGIIVKDGADAVEELNKRFHGAAESIDPAIRAQRRLAEEWEHFHRAVGEAILSAGGGATFMDTLLGVIRALTTAVSENKEGFAALASGMLWLQWRDADPRPRRHGLPRTGGIPPVFRAGVRYLHARHRQAHRVPEGAGSADEVGGRGLRQDGARHHGAGREAAGAGGGTSRHAHRRRRPQVGEG